MNQPSTNLKRVQLKKYEEQLYTALNIDKPIGIKHSPFVRYSPLQKMFYAIIQQGQKH